jgi:hypothetical protein
MLAEGKSMLPTDRLPAPTATRLTPVATLAIDNAPDTVNEKFEFIVRELAVTFVKVILAQLAFALMVTLNPPTILTISPATGAEAPGVPPAEADHVDVAFQFPDATEYLVAADTAGAIAIPSKMMQRTIKYKLPALEL